MLKTFLKETDLPSNHPSRQTVYEFLRKYPGQIPSKELDLIHNLLRKAYRLDRPEKPLVDPFETLIPEKGWFRDYFELTRGAEPPSAFHFAASLTVLGAALERQVYVDKGFYKVYPNIAMVIIAPTGRCRKTSATNFALKFAREVGVNVLSDRLTPEAVAEGLQGRDPAAGIIYAPELAVFLGKQKYLDGMVPLLTSLFDAPDTWNSRTIGRGELTLADVALSFLGASTLEWFVESLPREAFSGGFMSRLLFCVQHDTPRRAALPQRYEGHEWEQVRETLQRIRDDMCGEVMFGPKAKDWYVTWYDKHHGSKVIDDKFAGYHERKPDHLLRIAMLLHIATYETLRIDTADLELALRILDWWEQFLPSLFDTVATTAQGADIQKILDLLRQAGGTCGHSLLMRRMQHRMNARTFREAVLTLIDSGSITEERDNERGHYYRILEGATPWKD